MATEHLHPAGTELDLTLELPGDPGPIACRARVVWVNHPEWVKAQRLPHGMGIQFLRLPSDVATRLSRFYLQRLEETPVPPASDPSPGRLS